MKLLKTINPENVDENNIPGWEYRKAARAVVFDNENKVGLLDVSSKNYYKLPGGGIEEGEDIKIALDRECEEELGVQVEVLKEKVPVNYVFVDGLGVGDVGEISTSYFSKAFLKSSIIRVLTRWAFS